VHRAHSVCHEIIEREVSHVARDQVSGTRMDRVSHHLPIFKCAGTRPSVCRAVGDNSLPRIFWRTFEVRDAPPRVCRSASTSTCFDQVHRKPSARAPTISKVRVIGEASALASRKSSGASLTEQLGLNVSRGSFGHAAHELAAVPLVLVQWYAVVSADLGGL